MCKRHASNDRWRLAYTEVLCSCIIYSEHRAVDRSMRSLDRLKQDTRVVELSQETVALLAEAMTRYHPGNLDSALQAALKIWLKHSSNPEHEGGRLPN